jgi:hypothetical protein
MHQHLQCLGLCKEWTQTWQILRKAMSLEGLFEVCWFARITYKQHFAGRNSKNIQT